MIDIKKIFHLSNPGNISAILLAISYLLFLYPYFTWNIVSIISPIAFLLLLIGIAFEFVVFKRIEIKPYLWFYLIYICFSNLTGINLRGDFLETSILVSILLLLFPKTTIAQVFIRFYYIFGVLLFFSIIFYLFKVTNFYTPLYSDIIAPDKREYFAYPFNVMLKFEQTNLLYLTTGFYRFYSFLNEPGYIGTLCALIVCAFKFRFKGNKFLYIYLLGALLSLSLGSYLTLLVGFLFVIDLKNIFRFGVPVVCLILFQWNLVEKHIVKRLQISENNVAGDNRTTIEFDKAWERLFDSSDVFFGKGKSQHTAVSDGGVSSWKVIVYNSGVFGLILYLSIIISIYFSFSNRTKYSLMLLLVYFLTIYHRPNVHLSPYLLIFIFGLLNAQKGSDLSKMIFSSK